MTTNTHTIRLPFGLLDALATVDAATGTVQLQATDVASDRMALRPVDLDAAWTVLSSWCLEPGPGDPTRGRTTFSPQGWAELYGHHAALTLAPVPA